MEVKVDIFWGYCCSTTTVTTNPYTATTTNPYTATTTNPYTATTTSFVGGNSGIVL